MGWSCEACTYLNHVESLNKCAMCETIRLKVGSQNVACGKTSSIDNGSMKRSREPKSTVQATLFGGKATNVETRMHKDKKSKRSSNTEVAANPHIFFNTTRPLSATSATTINQFEIWKQTAKNDTSLSKLEERTRTAMKQIFCVEKLRLLQPKAVKCALKRKSQTVVMATGGAVVLGGTTIVISPLIALMVDQVKALNDKGVKAALLSSGNGETTNREIMERLLGRPLSNSKAKRPQTIKEQEFEHITLLYVTPEQVQTTRFRDAMGELHKKKQLSLFAVDEAHCLSCWGHDFRKAYMRLGYLRENFPDVPLIACTATATPKVIEDIKRVLHLESCPCYVGSFDRPNIFYKVLYKDVIDAESMEGSRGHLIRFIQKQHERCDSSGSKCSGIVYCHTRAETTDLAKSIQKQTRISTEAYHGGLKVHERNRVQHAWTSGESKIAVATVAFGMGIDLPHVRYVVHWNMAKSPEAFYQESGRAGRDGLPAYSILYYAKGDVSKFQYLLSQRPNVDNKPHREMIGLDAMVSYCVTPGCRRCILLKHFGEPIEDPKDLCNASCDFCVDPSKVEKSIAAANEANQFCFSSRQTEAYSAEQIDEYDEQSASEECAEDWCGLGITKSIERDFDHSPSHQKKFAPNFEKASNILAKYEAVEMKSASFVTFKAKTAASKGESKNNTLHIPSHFIPANVMAPKAIGVSTRTEPSSSYYATEAERLRDEINKSKLELEARRKGSTK